MRLRLTVVIGMTLSCISAKDPKRDWKVGTLTQITYGSRTVGGGPVAISHSSSRSISNSGHSSNPSVEAAANASASAGASAAEAANAASMASAVAANRPRTITAEGLALDGEGYTFLLMYVIGRHQPNVTVHGPIKYTMEKGKFYILDDDGKEFRLTVLEKALKQQQPKQP